MHSECDNYIYKHFKLLCEWLKCLDVQLFCSVVNSLRPKQHGHQFPDDIFECIFMNENVWIFKFLLKIVPDGPIKNTLALVQIMAWRQLGNKPLSEPMMVLLQHIYASLGLNELMTQNFSRLMRAGIMIYEKASG